MSFTMFSPSWFFGIDVGLELAFAVVTLIVALFALKIYRLSDQQQAKLFGISFLLISISYFIQSLLNYLIISKLDQNISSVMKLQSVIFLDTIEIYAHMVLMMAGLALLAYMTFRTTKLRLYLLLLISSLGAIFMSENTLYMFFLMTSLYLLFICWHQFDTYIRNRDTKTLLIVLAFILLLFGQIHFIISVNHELFYVIGHVLELLAYLLVLWNFYLVQKYGQKTRTA
jgi:hypothetical protein